MTTHLEETRAGIRRSTVTGMVIDEGSMLVSSRVAALVDTHSPMVEQAATIAAAKANARGLLDSTMGLQAVTEAALGAAQSIAQTDAKLFVDVEKMRVDATNEAERDYTKNWNNALDDVIKWQQLAQKAEIEVQQLAWQIKQAAYALNSTNFTNYSKAIENILVADMTAEDKTSAMSYINVMFGLPAGVSQFYQYGGNLTVTAGDTPNNTLEP